MSANPIDSRKRHDPSTAGGDSPVSSASLKVAAMQSERRRVRRRQVGTVVAVLGVAAAAVIGLRWLVSADADTSPIAKSVDVPGVPGEPTPDGGLLVTRSDFGAEWPLTIESGEIRCRDGAVTIRASDVVYALNAQAQDSDLGQALAPVWAANPARNGARMSTGALIDSGLELC